MGRINEILLPFATGKFNKYKENGSRFAHYTTYETALKIIKNKTMFLSHYKSMNDLSELDHGLSMIDGAIEKSGILDSIDLIQEGLGSKVKKEFDGRKKYFKDYYFTCFSVHEKDDDKYGKLSMWRAYGGDQGVAFIMRREPFLDERMDLKIISSPIAYEDKTGFLVEFNEVKNNIEKEISFLKKIKEEDLINSFVSVLTFGTLCVKHEGFKEEQELRVLYNPNLLKSDKILLSKNENGDSVYKVPLQSFGSNSLDISLNNLIDRVIIGPCLEPEKLSKGLACALSDAGVVDAASKIHYSGIPLRIEKRPRSFCINLRHLFAKHMPSLFR